MSALYTGAHLFVDALEEYGVTHVFGNPGTTELPVMNAIGESDLDYILGLHEDIAVGMAGGYAQTRRYHAHDDPTINPAGVVNLHIAPGLAHGLGNVYAAKIAGAPLVITAGNHSTDFRHEEPILSGDLVQMIDQFTKWSDEVLDVSALPTMLRRAFRVALTPPTGPVFLGLPLDVMLAETDAEPERLGAIPTAGDGDPSQINAATKQLINAESPVLIVGDHVARAGQTAVEAAVDLAESAGLRVHGEMLASEVSFPTAHDQWISYMPPVEDLARGLMDTDMLVFVGCSTHTMLTRYEEQLLDPATTCIHISQDPWELGKNYVADVAIIGDPGLVMANLADQISAELDDTIRQSRLEDVYGLREMSQERMARIGEGSPADDEKRASKATLVDSLREVVDDAYIVDEGITAKYVMLTRWPMGANQYISNKGGGLGYGLPASVGAGIAEQMQSNPRTVIGYVGDGSYLYYPHTLYSAARYNVDLTVVIPDNRNYRILKDNTLSLLGGDEDEYDFVGMDFEPPVDIPANAESHGARGHLVETAEEIHSTLESVIDQPGPDVVDILVHD